MRGQLVDLIKQSARTVYRQIELRLRDIQEDGKALLETVRWKDLHLQ